MKTLYFAVYDKKVEAFGQLFPAATRGAAERSFADSLKDQANVAAKHPEDFALFTLFVFNDESGYVEERFEPPQLVVEASSLVG